MRLVRTLSSARARAHTHTHTHARTCMRKCLHTCFCMPHVRAARGACAAWCAPQTPSIARRTAAMGSFLILQPKAVLSSVHLLCRRIREIVLWTDWVPETKGVSLKPKV